ncbi:MAG: MBL fold metallo-hydrolase [Allosphingosinicella sp.]|uniref:MBL fold metallo-hydrolase n=1 Tax=Allosphingosinicella sp. TaxID=2823234 RepID=UPI00392756C2
MRFILGLAAAAAVAAPLAAQGAAPDRLLARAETAIGPADARVRAEAFRARQSGTGQAAEQAADPADPVALVRRSYAWSFDAAAGRMIREAEQVFPGEVRFLTRAALTPEGGWSVDLLRWRTGTDLAAFGAEDAARSRAQFERFFPHLLLRQARAAGRLEPAGPDGFAFTDPAGDRIEVSVDPATGLPLNARRMVEGRAQTEIGYDLYARRAGIMLPSRTEIRQAGGGRETVWLGRFDAGAAPLEAHAPPPGYAPPPPPGEPRLAARGDGVHLFENMPAGYRSAAIAHAGGLILVEAPLNPAYAALQKRLLDAALPGRPVTHVLVTHPHSDHVGGLKAWHDAGATIVAARGARVALERQLRAAGAEGELRIEEVADRRSLDGGPVRIDLHAFAGRHSAANLLVHLPERKILFQGDLFFVPERGEVPPQFPIAGELHHEIVTRGLAVEEIVGIHGRPAGLADLRLAVERGPAF